MQLAAAFHMIDRLAPSSSSLLSISHTIFLRFVDVGLARLHGEQLLDLGIAVAGVVALRLAGEVLEIVLVGIVDAVAGGVEADRVVLARDLGEPLRGLDDVDSASIQISLSWPARITAGSL